MHTNAPEDKDIDICGIAGLNLETSGATAATNLIQSASMFEGGEQRSSSAMAEYRVEGMTNMRANLPHSISSPALPVLNQNQAQTHVSMSNPNGGAGFASGTGSLGASQQNLKALLPAYRPAPDYETAVRVKYGDDIAKLLLNPTPAVQQTVQQPTQTPTVLQGFQPQHQQNSQQQLQMMKLYKPPPPYPYSKVGSNSSPDLAVTTNGAPPVNSGSMSQLPISQAQTEIMGTLRNGEPIYQNIPLRQPGSQPNLSPNIPNIAAQVVSQTRRKWGLPVRSSARSAVINRVQSDSPSSSPACKRNPNETSVNSATHGSDLTAVKDHLVSRVTLRYNY